MLVLAAVVAAAFFGSFWGRNAEALGGHDMGTALGLSFAVPVTFYASLACAALSAAGAAVARTRGRAVTRWMAAFGVSLLPGLFLLMKDAM
jgi:hypothetical protein